MNLKERVNQILDRYKNERFQENALGFHIKKIYTKATLSGQISSILIEAIDDITKSSGLKKCEVIEYLIYIGLINTGFTKKN